MKELNLDELFAGYTDEAAAKEATAFKTVPTGSYNHKGEKYQAGIGDDERLTSLLGREYAHLSGPITTKTGDRRGQQFFDVSWIEYRVNPATKKGERITDENREQAVAEQWPQDKAFKLWNQLAVAFDAVKKPIREVLEMYKMYPTTLFITESYNTGNGWRSARTTAEKAEFLQAGYDPKNFVQSIGKMK
jgi:hypothetical protein